MDSAVLKLSTEKILARKEDGIGWLTFNQPEKRNAISIEMWDACPSSNALGERGGWFSGGSGASGVDVRRLGSGAASAAAGWSGA